MSGEWEEEGNFDRIHRISGIADGSSGSQGVFEGLEE